MIGFDACREMVDGLEPRAVRGTVAAVRGLRLLVRDLPLPIGALVRLEAAGGGGRPVRGEVVGFEDDRALVMLFGSAAGVGPGTGVLGEQSQQTVGVGADLLGRVIDGLGRPLDEGPPVTVTSTRPLTPRPVSALERRSIVEPLPTGVRVVDGLLTLGKGQRIGVFSGPGVGKSTLLATIARNTAADVNVIALIGERGREVRDFLERALGPDGRARSVVVVATGDESPLLRVRAAYVACAVAEHFRELGRDVMLMMDSVTRFAQAQRQIGLTAGEQPATKGYPPSVFAQLPVLLERAGATGAAGSITGLYSVLVEGDDLSEPISDAARGVLDGHIALSRKLAGRGFFPAVDVGESISRVADDVCDPAHIEARRAVRALIAAYAEAEELISIGAYAPGSDPVCDVAIALKGRLDAYRAQDSGDGAAYPETCRSLIDIARDAAQLRAQRAAAAGGTAAAPAPGPGTPRTAGTAA